MTDVVKHFKRRGKELRAWGRRLLVVREEILEAARREQTAS